MALEDDLRNLSRVPFFAALEPDARRLVVLPDAAVGGVDGASPVVAGVVANGGRDGLLQRERRQRLRLVGHLDAHARAGQCALRDRGSFWVLERGALALGTRASGRRGDEQADGGHGDEPEDAHTPW